MKEKTNNVVYTVWFSTNFINDLPSNIQKVIQHTPHEKEYTKFVFHKISNNF